MTNYERQEELWAAIEQNPGKPEVYWPLMVEFVAEWLRTTPEGCITSFAGNRLAARWREEMS